MNYNATSKVAQGFAALTHRPEPWDHLMLDLTAWANPASASTESRHALAL